MRHSIGQIGDGSRLLQRFGAVLSLLLLAGSHWIGPAFGQPVSMPAPIAAAARSANAQEKKTIGPFIGAIVDPAGKPVAGAKVLMLTYDDMPLETKVLVETVSDSKGQFRVEKQPWETSPEQRRGWFFTARDSQGRFAAQVHRYQTGPQPPPSAATVNIELKFFDGQDYHGRLLDMSGRPIAKAGIRPTSWNDHNPEERYSANIFFPSESSKELSSETDAEGRFTLKNVPTTASLGVKIRAEGYGEPYGTLQMTRPAVLKLARVGRIEGSVACAKEPKAAAGIKLRLEPPRQRYFNPNEQESTVLYWAQGATKADGSFRFDNVPAGQYQVTAELPATFAYNCDAGEPIEVKAGQAAKASLSLKPAVVVRGKIVDQKTGEGIGGISVYVFFQDGRGTSVNPKTGADGNFTLYTRPGKAVLNIYQVPEKYLPPSQRRQQTIEIKGDMTLDTIRLERAGALEGLVVDKSGKPVADAEVRYIDTESNFSPNDVIRSDAEGRFSLKKTSPKKSYIVRVRTNSAAAEPTSVVPEQVKGPLRLVIDEKTAFTIHGVVVDEAGKPLPQIDVSLITHWNWAGGGIGFVFSSQKTDSQGRFQFGGLWAGDKYQIRINAKDRPMLGSRQIASTPGGVEDCGKLVLAAVSGVVEGQVVDSAGKPLGDVRVFNSGDGIALIQTLSDKAGRFRLQGFRTGPVYVFVEKDGYRFSGARTTSGVKDVKVTLRRTDEPAPPWAPASHAISKKEQRKAAHKLLETLWKANVENYRRTACMRMAQIDPDLARKWSKEANIPLQQPPDRSSLEKIAREDVDEALSVIAKQGAGGFYTLKDLANSLASSDPDKAIRYAEEALVRARSLDQPQRAIALAQIGAIVTRLGNKEAGQKLIGEAADMAEKWTPSDRNQYMFGQLAAAVAPHDLPRAIRLLEKIPVTQRDSYLANIAASLDDIDKAEAILKDVQPWSAQRARMRLAYRIAAQRPAEAIRLMEKAPQPGYGDNDDTKALGYGWLATAIAPRDAKLAYSLVDRAFAIYLKPSQRSFGNYGGRSTQAALLALQARQIGYPDMNSVLCRTLASRPLPDRNDFSPARIQESYVMMAMYLGLLDPSVSQQILEGLEPQSSVIGSGYSGVGRSEWLKAWVLADPAHAVELAEKEIAAKAKDDNQKRQTVSAVYEMADLLLTPPEDRLKQLTRRGGGIWSPEQEY